MKGHGTKYTHKMDQAVAALLYYGTVDEAARATGIGVNTLSRWMKRLEFQAALRKARHMVFSRAIGRLKNAAEAAATTVLKIMVDTNTPTGIRLRAAEIVLNQAGKACETEAVEVRLEKMDRLGGSPGKSRRRSADLVCPSAASLPEIATVRAQLAAPSANRAETGEDAVE